MVKISDSLILTLVMDGEGFFLTKVGCSVEVF
jgi:hypothetical protein